MKKQNAITLVALVITIILLLILAVVAIKEVSGDGLITQAIKVSFYQEMSELEEKKELAKISTFISQYTGGGNNSFLAENLSIEELQNLSETLKAEIVYVRNSFGGKERITTKQVWNNNLFECQDTFANEEYLEGLTKDIYYISKKSSGKEKTYLYDRVSDTCYKIPQTRIGKYVVHSLPYARFIVDGINVEGIGVVNFDAGISSASDGTLAYEPDLNNFSYTTQIVYYSPDFSTEHTISIQEFIDQGKPSTKTVNGEIYTFANYTSTGTKVWANIKTTANGLEAYWVWIPRYAYKLDSTNYKSDIIFVDVNDKQMDGTALPEGYTVHEAFKQKNGLKGIWFSKYDPSPVETGKVDNTNPATPDLTNFEKSADKLQLVYYDSNGNIEYADYTQNPAQVIEKNGVKYYWYDYPNKIWANIKTTANELEAWWVWIPRYAYKLESGTTKVIFVDKDNKPLDKETFGTELPAGYTVHEAFNQKEGLMGIWFSKYDPSPVTQKTTEE